MPWEVIRAYKSVEQFIQAFHAYGHNLHQKLKIFFYLFSVTLSIGVPLKIL